METEDKSKSEICIANLNGLFSLKLYFGKTLVFIETDLLEQVFIAFKNIS